MQQTWHQIQVDTILHVINWKDQTIYVESMHSKRLLEKFVKTRFYTEAKLSDANQKSS